MGSYMYWALVRVKFVLTVARVGHARELLVEALAGIGGK